MLQSIKATRPAQTNLQLYMQMLEEGYTEEEVSIINKAYLFSINKVHLMYRGSGKPFICHLVGTASLMVNNKQSIEVVLAALMHALYQNRVPFDGHTDITKRREIITTRFGSECDRLIYEYTEFEKTGIKEINPDHIVVDKHVLLMRIADELEDLVDFSLCLHGLQGETAEKGGSYLSRRARKEKEGKILMQLCTQHAAPQMYDSLAYWLDFKKYDAYPDSLKTGFYSSITI
jgi:(p)ppGpp synthase/HD superfamily hydrolase